MLGINKVSFWHSLLHTEQNMLRATPGKRTPSAAALTDNLLNIGAKRNKVGIHQGHVRDTSS